MVLTTSSRWTPTSPPLHDHLLVVAPHPDDEVLGAAGIMMWARDNGRTVSVVAVTDGEASHAGSSDVTETDLRQWRERERLDALETLGLGGIEITRLSLPDSDVGAHVEHLIASLALLATADTTVVVPASTDFHPDHMAVNRAGHEAATSVGAAVFEMPVWTRVDRAVAPAGAHVLTLSAEAHDRKAAAVACFRSQIEPIGAGPAAGPVIHPHELRAMTSRTEWLCA